eukprot:CAMPEP_0167768658 /NCGR_PEP_ID=MMETSP0110_2-20121227/16806_1 /TAXON_ID=629695 /ORGANISM="Gymnochlora sp., Strain CCMP2014" /LENGTH=149 /DNA_ID=CAMNT_0007657389 /DNA_START=210 /DNA_END=656 /DNA_ORIENTATION=+
MRQYFTEGDLISSEVQQVKSDGAIHLHTRSLKYGKLNNGVFLSVPASLIKRCKNHFHILPCGVHIILGNNGYIWLQSKRKVPEKKKSSKEEVKSKVKNITTPEEREKICRVRNSIVVLSKMSIAIYAETVMDVYKQSRELGLSARDILD